MTTTDEITVRMDVDGLEYVATYRITADWLLQLKSLSITTLAWTTGREVLSSDLRRSNMLVPLRQRALKIMVAMMP